MPENDPRPDTRDQQEPEEEEEEPEEGTDDTIPYGSTDTDQTLDYNYNDLVIGDSQWCLLSQEHKFCSNTASFSVPRLIDGSPVALNNVESSNSIGMPYSVNYYGKTT